MTLDDALTICADRSITRGEIAQLCDATAADIDAALDAIAIEVAHRYLRGNIPFLSADTLMNNLFSHAVMHSGLPSVFMRAYEAFDEGEYHHAGDAEGVDTEVAYTKPLLSALISEGLSPNKSLERTRER